MADEQQRNNPQESQKRKTGHIRWPVIPWRRTSETKNSVVFRKRVQDIWKSVVSAFIEERHDSVWNKCCLTFKRHGRKGVQHPQEEARLLSRILRDLEDVDNDLSLEENFFDWIAMECQHPEYPNMIFLPTVNMLHPVPFAPLPELQNQEEEEDQDDALRNLQKKVDDQSDEISSLKFDVMMAQQKAEQYRNMLAEEREEKVRLQDYHKQIYEDACKRHYEAENVLQVELQLCESKVDHLQTLSNISITKRHEIECERDDLIRQLKEMKNEIAIKKKKLKEKDELLGKRCKYCMAGKPLPSDAEIVSMWLEKKKAQALHD